jgi:hypothetical protein
MNSADYIASNAALKKMGLVDGLGEEEVHQMDGCYKMRHANGGQPTKFCGLIFHRIDKIMSPVGWKPKNTSTNLQTFRRHDLKTNHGKKPERAHEDHKEAEFNVAKIQKLHEHNGTWGELAAKLSVVQLYLANPEYEADRDMKMFYGIDLVDLLLRFIDSYDSAIENTKPLADRMLVLLRKLVLSETFTYTKDSKEFGKQMSPVVYVLQMLENLGSRPDLEQQCEIDKWGRIQDGQEDHLKKIYPNVDAPSDHPPYVVTFTEQLTRSDPMLNLLGFTEPLRHINGVRHLWKTRFGSAPSRQRTYK